jgi:signal transduction histidine kinase
MFPAIPLWRRKAMALNRRILLQVTMPAVLISLALFAICLLGVRSINQLQENRAQILHQNVRSLQAAQELEIRLRQLRFHSFLFVMDPSAKREKPIALDHDEFEAALKKAKNTNSVPEGVNLIQKIESGYQRYRAELKEGKFPPLAATRSDLLHWADEHPVQFLMTPCEELLQVNRAAMEASAEQSEAFADQARAYMLLLAILGPISGLFGGFGVAWGLSRTISRLRVRLQDVHEHLDQNLGSVRLTGVGSFDQLDRQLGQVLDRVQHVVAESQKRQQEVLRSEQLAAVGQLAASVAHEVRNPLTSIKLLVGAALRSQPHKGLRVEDLRVIHEEVGRLENKVQALLDFARPPESQRQNCDLREVIRHALELVQTRIQQQKVRLESELPDQPVHAQIDRDQFTSVLVNLFMNALDAMPNGGNLEVSLAVDPDGSLQLRVADTGGGIDAAVADRLFTPFTSTKATGTGLGLSVCRRVVLEHGGQLTAANQPSAGACFTIRLPAQHNEVAYADVTGR